MTHRSCIYASSALLWECIPVVNLPNKTFTTLYANTYVQMYKEYAEHTCDMLRVAGCVYCKSFIGTRVLCTVRSSPSMAHHGESPGFRYFPTISRQTSSINVTPISLAIVWYPIIIEYPNAAHIPFWQIPICYPKYSTMYLCVCIGGTGDKSFNWNTWLLTDFLLFKQ